MINKAHIIQSAISLGHAKGGLSEMFAEESQATMEKEGFEVTRTIINGKKEYNVNTEMERFKSSSIIFFHFPIFWFDLPGLVKEYIDDVYQYGTFFGPSAGKGYGTGGLMKGKKYVTVTTTNAAESNFGNGTFINCSPEEMLSSFHLTQKYCGLTNIGSKNFYNVIHGDMSNARTEYQKYMESILPQLKV